MAAFIWKWGRNQKWIYAFNPKGIVKDDMNSIVAASFPGRKIFKLEKNTWDDNWIYLVELLGDFFLTDPDTKKDDFERSTTKDCIIIHIVMIIEIIRVDPILKEEIIVWEETKVLYYRTSSRNLSDLNNLFWSLLSWFLLN